MTDTSPLRSGARLAAIAAICTALVALMHQLTEARITANEQSWLEQSLQPVLGGLTFDSGIIDSKVSFPAPHELPGAEDAVVYRAYRQGRPVAALFVVSAREGYSGPIRLLVGIDVDGQVTGVHVLGHRETPGLGDLVETSKSNWAMQFDGRSLGDPVASGWAIRRDGGAFDQLTGASVTPRAIVKAVRETLEYFAIHRDEVFAAPADEAAGAER